MRLTDLFKRGRSNGVLGARHFTLAITGHGVTARPILPASIAHLADGTLVLGPFDLPAAKASGTAMRDVVATPARSLRTDISLVFLLYWEMLN